MLVAFGIGTSKELAIEDADRQADLWFEGQPWYKESQEAEPFSREMNGRVIAWKIEVNYFKENSDKQGTSEGSR